MNKPGKFHKALPTDRVKEDQHLLSIIFSREEIPPLPHTNRFSSVSESHLFIILSQLFTVLYNLFSKYIINVFIALAYY